MNVLSSVVTVAKLSHANTTVSDMKDSTVVRRSLSAVVNSRTVTNGAAVVVLRAPTPWAGTFAAKPAASASSLSWKKRPWSKAAIRITQTWELQALLLLLA